MHEKLDFQLLTEIFKSGYRYFRFCSPIINDCVGFFFFCVVRLTVVLVLVVVCFVCLLAVVDCVVVLNVVAVAFRVTTKRNRPVPILWSAFAVASVVVDFCRLFLVFCFLCTCTCIMILLQCAP